MAKGLYLCIAKIVRSNMQTQLQDADFLSKSSSLITKITCLCDGLMQLVEGTNLEGHINSIRTIMNRFSQYVIIANTDALDVSGLETINVIEETSAGVKSSNMITHRKGNRIQADFGRAKKEEEHTDLFKIEIPACLPIMKQAIYQIVDNAVKYTVAANSFKVRVNKYNEGDKERTTISFTNLGPMLYEDEVDCIFDKSVRGENAEKSKPASGLGLGLTLVDKIVECHKWIDASVYAESGPSKVMLNGIEYSDFSIVLDFKSIPDEEKTVADKDIKDLKGLIELMFKHELSGSMPELTRLAHVISDHCINSRQFNDTTKKVVYELFDVVVDLIFYLYGQGVDGRPNEMRGNDAVDSIVAKYIRWAYIYIYNRQDECRREGTESFAPLPLFNNFLIVAQTLSKYVSENGTDLILRSFKDQFEIVSAQPFVESAGLMALFNKLLADSRMAITVNNERIIISKIR